MIWIAMFGVFILGLVAGAVFTVCWFWPFVRYAERHKDCTRKVVRTNPTR